MSDVSTLALIAGVCVGGITAVIVFYFLFLRGGNEPDDN